MANKNQKYKQRIKNNLKKISSTTKIVCVLMFFIFTFLGVYAGYYVTKNDTFEIIGEKEIYLNVGEEYIEQGVKIIAFGRDISNDVIISGEVDTTKTDVYVLTYKVNNFRFMNYTLYKKIIVGDVPNG